ncbi:uncharacterized protein LOC134841767 [Symsagittifera roscoffensis]|uniref:uncharacterized protein LOC134841767 n=1 Tax=Symsagittifera roscoffensis TaxID=84072 RepID=UPI00307C8E98
MRKSNRKFFVYSFDSKMDNRPLKKLSCSFGGEWQLITDDRNCFADKALKYVEMYSDTDKNGLSFTMYPSLHNDKSKVVESAEICTPLSIRRSKQEHIGTYSDNFGALCLNVNLSLIDGNDQKTVLEKGSIPFCPSRTVPSRSSKTLDSIRSEEGRCLSGNKMTSSQLRQQLEGELQTMAIQAEHHLNIVDLNPNCPFDDQTCDVCSLDSLLAKLSSLDDNDSDHQLLHYPLERGQVTWRTSTIKYSQEAHLIRTQFNTSTQAERKSLQDSICLTNALEVNWKKAFSSGSRFKWLYYLDSKTRFVRSYPGFTLADPESCNEPKVHDSATERVFASIQSPAKRVVLVASHSNKGTKSSSLLSNLLLALFDTITSNDLFQFVNTESPSMPFQLEQMREADRARVRQQMVFAESGVTEGNQISTMVERAFQLLNYNSDNRYQQNACVKVLLLIIDHTIDLTLLNQVKHLNSLSTNQVRVFVYSVGLANQDSVARQVACDNFGAWYKMDSQSDLVVAREYYTMLAEPNFASQVTWTKQDPVGFDANSQLGACVPVVTISKLGTAKMQGTVCGSIDETSFFQFPNALACVCGGDSVGIHLVDGVGSGGGRVGGWDWFRWGMEAGNC